MTAAQSDIGYWIKKSGCDEHQTSNIKHQISNIQYLTTKKGRDERPGPKMNVSALRGL
jgi:hypothetical protein